MKRFNLPIVLLGLLFLGLHAAYQVKVISSSSWPHLWGISGVATPQWEKMLDYTQQVAAVGPSTPFPITPALSEDSRFHGYAWISVYLRKAVLVGVGRNWDAYFLVIESLFPLLGFVFLSLILRDLYPDSKWLGPLCAFASLLQVWPMPIVALKNFSPAIGLDSLLVTTRTLEISRSSSPSVTLSLFIASTWLCLRIFSTPKEWIIGAVWALHLFLYPFNAAVGLSAFLAAIAVDLAQNKPPLKRTLMRILLLGTAHFIVALPFLWISFISPHPIDKAWTEKMHWWTRADGWFNAAGPAMYLFSIFIPLGTLVLSLGCKIKIEARHWVFLSMMAISVVFSQLHMILGKFLHPPHFQWKFLFFLQFSTTPTVLILCRRLLKDEERSYTRTTSVIHRALPAAAVATLSLLSGWGFLFRSIQVRGAYRFHETYEAPEMLRVSGLLNELTTGVDRSDRVLSEDMGVSALAPVIKDRKTIVVNTFHSRLDDDLYAKLQIAAAKMLGWSEADALGFLGIGKDPLDKETEVPMVPGARLRKTESLYFSKKWGPIIAGQWPPITLTREEASEYYRTVDLAAVARRYRVRAIQAKAIDPSLMHLVEAQTPSLVEPGVINYRLSPQPINSF